MSKITYATAIRDGLRAELRRCPDVYIAGEDVGAFGGNFGETTGLYDEFGHMRVLDTPISETAIIGHGVGAAAAGLRPVVEIMHMDFLGICLDEILNQAAKIRYMFGGKITVPMVIKTTCGAGVGASEQHSQSLEAYLTHIPGIKVVCPSNPADAKGLMISAIQDENPVAYIAHKVLMSQKGEVDDADIPTPLGVARVMKEGGDVTVLSWSQMVNVAMDAAGEMEKQGINAEVIDLRSLAPLDKETIIKSVEKTGRLVIVHEAVKTGGFGGEIAAILAEEAFSSLKAPIKRVTGADTPIPFSPVLEYEFLPNVQKIVDAVKSIG